MPESNQIAGLRGWINGPCTLAAQSAAAKILVVLCSLASTPTQDTVSNRNRLFDKMSGISSSSSGSASSPRKLTHGRAAP